MLHCMNNNSSSGNLAADSCSSDITVLERMNWQQQQQQHHQSYFSSSIQQVQNSQGSSSSSSLNHSPSGFINHFHMPIVAAPGIDVNSAISRTFSCPPVLVDPKLNHSPSLGKDNCSNKRKPEKAHNPKLKIVDENDNKDKKRIKVGVEDGESKITRQASGKLKNTNNKKEKCDTSNSKASEVQNEKPDYIHVRARRGQATDSHSLAERVRREKISERMKYLQDLVPGCNKITGKAGMLDEIINYVQSLQRQVEFLSMKLATVNPRHDFNIDDLFEKEVFPNCDANATFSAVGISSELNSINPYVQFNSPQQFVSYGGLDNTGMNPSDMGLRRTISAPVSLPETFIDSSCFSQILPSTTWEGDFQNLYNNLSFDQARATSFSSQSQLFTGLGEASNLKMEM